MISPAGLQALRRLTGVPSRCVIQNVISGFQTAGGSLKIE